MSDELTDEDVQEHFKRNNLWPQPSVIAKPQITIDAWQVVRVIHAPAGHEEKFGFHFVGRDCFSWGGAVSSKIVAFDPDTMRGTTASGRVYQLRGDPGYDRDADFVLMQWYVGNKVKVVEATKEFLENFGIEIPVAKA